MSDTLYEQLTTGNIIYQDHYERWRFLMDSYEGGARYKAGQYLTKYQLESELEYQARINATPLDNQCASIISTYNSFLFREEPERNYGSAATMPELADFIEDVDFDGRSIDSFMKEVSTWAKVFGHCWMLCVKPNVNATTRADEIAQGIRPYLTMLTPLTVLDWVWERDISGRYSLSLLRYVEDVNGNTQTIRIWTKDTIQTHTVDTRDKVITGSIEEVNELGLIPAVIAYNGRSVVRGIGISAINDIADAQKFIYNCTSEVDQSIRLDSHPSLVKTPETQAGVGAGAIIAMPENLDPALKPYVLDFAGANIDNIYTAINNTVDSIDKMASVGSVRATQAKTMSGVAMEVDFQLLNAKLSEQADCLELAEEQMWKLWCMYYGIPYDMEIEYPDTFNIKDTANEIKQLQIAASANPVDPRTRAAIDMAILDWLDLDEDELAAIKDPALIDLETVTEPGEIPE